MNSKLRTVLHLSIGLAISLGAVLAAPAQNSAPAGNSANQRGHICNQSGAMITGAKITMSNSPADATTTTSADATSVEAHRQSTDVATASSKINSVTGGNASSTVSKIKTIETPADDPDELARDLSALAGPSAGPDSSPIFIDPAFL